MAAKKPTKALDTTAEERIKNAARLVFYQKGYAATRTRDIAEEAGINLALLNYYFRSKEKLFQIIMTEALSAFFQNLAIVLNDEKTTLEKKVEDIAAVYIEQIIKEPEMPTFIISEIRNNPEGLLEKLPVKGLFINSIFVKQHHQAVTKGEISEPSPLQFLMNLLGLVVFPFIGKPLLMRVGDLNETQFNKLMQERKKQIPLWINAIIKTK